MARPGPLRSASAARRPVIAISRASPGPVTFGPRPCAQSTSVARSCSPLIRRPAPRRGLPGTKSEHPLEPSGRHTARTAERPADVLVMDRAVAQGDHAAETGCQSLRLEVVTQQGEQLRGAQRGELVDAHLVGPHPRALRETLQQPELAELFIADHVRHNIFDGPLGAQALCLPVLRAQRGQKIREVGAFVVGHAHHRPDGGHRGTPAVRVT